MERLITYAAVLGISATLSTGMADQMKPTIDQINKSFATIALTLEKSNR